MSLPNDCSIHTLRINSLAQLQLMRWISPSLPIGAFAYSQGLEYVLEGQWVKDDIELEDWLRGVLTQGLGLTDLPVLYRFYQTLEQMDQQGEEGLARWDQWLRANRESQKLIFEDQQLGLALKRLLKNQGLIDDTYSLPDHPSYAGMYAIACYKTAIPADSAVLGFAWSWLENQISVACKSMPLGQTAAQKIISHMLGDLERVVARAKTRSDDELGGTLPGLGLASALHESQYSRLFRS